MIGAAAVLVTLGSVEVSSTKHAAITNGWVRSGLVILLIGLVVLIAAAVVYVVGARKPQPETTLNVGVGTRPLASHRARSPPAAFRPQALSVGPTPT